MNTFGILMIILGLGNCGSNNGNSEPNNEGNHVAHNSSLTFYISPNGSNSNPGTSDRPWRTFGGAIPKLHPGDTLILKDGTYTKSNTGLPYIICSSSGGTYAKHGTETQHITIKAENERKALLKSDGSVKAFDMRYCKFWDIEGLHVETSDFDTGNQSDQISTFQIMYSNHINVRKVLVTKHNRLVKGIPFAITYSDNILVEDSEVYYAIAHLINCYGSTRCIFRRVYVNARGWQPHPDRIRSIGDISAVFYGSSNSIMENVVVEGDDEISGCPDCGSQGMQIHSDAVGNMILGSIAINTNINGYRLDSRAVSKNLVKNTVLQNIVSYSNHDRGGFGSFVQLGAVNTQMENVSIIDASGSSTARGLTLDGRCAACGNGQPTNTSFHGENILSVGGSPAFQGFFVSSKWPILGGWDIEYTNAFNWTTAYVPTSGDAYGSFSYNKSTDPGLGGCIIYIPDSSPMKGAGKNGEDIGANVIYRYEDGLLTNEKLWDQTTGQFPCGAVVDGVNDDLNFPDSSCINVHKRLNVGVNGCPIP